MPMILIDSEVLATLAEFADQGAEYLAELATDCDTDGDAVEAAREYRERSVRAGAAVDAARDALAEYALVQAALNPEKEVKPC